ncbi:MbtH family protein [Streptomyces olivaceoviridis]|uniref:MbtH family protein n=1 Tax=Streptomyces olivaceoviridis TaxID=1921 RepID=UPI00368E78BE
MTADDSTGLHHVVVNHERQYSVWPADQAIPAGWSPIGVTSTLDECLAYIDREWTDLRPRSLRSSRSTRPLVNGNG